MTQTTDNEAPQGELTPLQKYRAELLPKLKRERNLIKLAARMKEVGEAYDIVKFEASKLNAEYEILSLELIPALMEEKAIENITLENIGRLTLTADIYVSIKAGLKADMFKWCRKNKVGDLIQEVINAGTLRSFVKRWMKDPKKAPKLPSALLNVTPYTRASITKA